MLVRDDDEFLLVLFLYGLLCPPKWGEQSMQRIFKPPFQHEAAISIIWGTMMSIATESHRDEQSVYVYWCVKEYRMKTQTGRQRILKRCVRKTWDCTSNTAQLQGTRQQVLDAAWFLAKYRPQADVSCHRSVPQISGDHAAFCSNLPLGLFSVCRRSIPVKDSGMSSVQVHAGIVKPALVARTYLPITHSNYKMEVWLFDMSRVLLVGWDDEIWGIWGSRVQARN